MAKATSTAADQPILQGVLSPYIHAFPGQTKPVTAARLSSWQD